MSPPEEIQGLLASADVDTVREGLRQAAAAGWDVQAVVRAMEDFLDILIPNGHFEVWLNEADVEPGEPFLRVAEGAVPLSAVLADWPAIVPFLPWTPGTRVHLSVEHFTFPTHDCLAADTFDDIDNEDPDAVAEAARQYAQSLASPPAWSTVDTAEDWKTIGKAFNDRTAVCLEPEATQLETSFQNWGFIRDALLRHIGPDTFLLGHYSEFEGHHNDDEWLALVARSV